MRNDIRNIAIIAHVDHGKTTLVDAMLKQSHIFRDNQQVGELIMDSNALEREKGITIMAKNTAIMYKGIKINIIDTPGHADFSGEVERVINMADGCLLLVDADEGPMPQTRFVLRQALEKGLRTVLVINKVDRPAPNISETIRKTHDLFLELATTVEQLDFPVLYTSGRKGWASEEPGVEGTSLIPLFEAIVKHIPPPAIEEGPFQMLVSNLDYDSHVGRIAIGRIFRGKVARNDMVGVIDIEGKFSQYKVKGVYNHLGLQRLEVSEASAGEIVALVGLDKASIGDTVASPEKPDALPRIYVGEPTVKMTFGVNTSPFAGREGKFCTSRQLRERLYKELEINVSLQVRDTGNANVFLVSGRGELHLAILIETMRREGYELEVSKPEAIYKEINGQIKEPVEYLIIDTREAYIGVITEIAAARLAQMVNMFNDGKGNVRMEFHIPTRGLIGLHSAFIMAVRGEGVMNYQFLSYEPWKGDIKSMRSGVLIASEMGTAVTYGLNHAQGRGITFVEPGTEVYEGMVVGFHSHSNDITVNVCKEKKMTNIRSSTSDIAVRLTPPLVLSLEQSLDFIADDELLEVTPKNLRMRKKLLSMHDRARTRADNVSAAAA